MSVNERIYKIDQILTERRFATIPLLLERLEISLATLKRDLALMRNSMEAPIIFDKELGGYRYDKGQDAQSIKYELPGLWFSAEEIHALLTMHHILSNLDTGGLLGGHIKPLLSRLTLLLSTADDPIEEIQKRVRIEMMNVRHVPLAHFQAVGSALLRRKRLSIDYYARGTNQDSQREISPQRLINYRGNWYLDAWCHLRNGLRSFSIDSFRRVEILEKSTKDVPEKLLNEVLGSGYGIFSGKKVQWATLLFSPETARWVANEHWHPKQKGRLLSNGGYELKIPYSKDTELLMDILKYGAGVKVIAPENLVKRVSDEIETMRSCYL
jgi:predicted DNA-binding transcriptional regulator YafY